VEVAGAGAVGRRGSVTRKRNFNLRRANMHYRNGREANNGDKIVKLDGGKVVSFGVLHSATPGNDYCMCDCIPSTTWPSCSRKRDSTSGPKESEPTGLMGKLKLLAVLLVWAYRAWVKSKPAEKPEDEKPKP
jgi:hypothetical protein